MFVEGTQQLAYADITSVYKVGSVLLHLNLRLGSRTWNAEELPSFIAKHWRSRPGWTAVGPARAQRDPEYAAQTVSHDACFQLCSTNYAPPPADLMHDACRG